LFQIFSQLDSFFGIRKANGYRIATFILGHLNWYALYLGKNLLKLLYMGSILFLDVLSFLEVCKVAPALGLKDSFELRLLLA